MTVTVNSALIGPGAARYANVYGLLADLGLAPEKGLLDMTGASARIDTSESMLTESGDYIITESGEYIILE